MSESDTPQVDPIAVDVGQIVQRTVASLYSHLVTRPTGRAVRLAIEGQVSQAGGRALSMVDLSEVTILDFSCADEVVAKLLLRFADRAPPLAYFVFLGVQDVHRGPIETVLERQSLAAVAESPDGGFELLGTATREEQRVWRLVESNGRLLGDELDRHLPTPEGREALDRLVRRRVVMEMPGPREVRSLSTLIPDQR